MYFHKSLIYNPIDLSNIFKDESLYPVEILTCEIKLKKEEKLLISNIYKSGNSSHESNVRLFDAMRTLNDLPYKHFLYVGDFNFPDISWENLTISSGSEHSLDYKFVECTLDCFLSQHVTMYTRGKGSARPPLLDLVLTNQEEAVQDITIGAPLGSSDHSVLHIEYRCMPVLEPDKIIYQYEKADYSKMKSMLDLDWEQTFSECQDDVNKMWEIFST